MQICLVYDCLYPWTVGGAERWYRALAEALVARGHAVTYLTLRQWPAAEPPTIPGVRVVAVGPRASLYRGGRRRIWPPLRFGLGVLAHLTHHGGGYDIVHSASFPYFSVIAAAIAAPLGRYRLVVDWWEFWTAAYWRDYLGPIGGRIGARVQRIVARLPQRALCFSRLHAARLVAEGGSWPTLIRGVYPAPDRSSGQPATARLGTAPAPQPPAADPTVVFVGRHIAEKRPAAIPPALVVARRSSPRLGAAILGDGPERLSVERLVLDLGLEGAVETPGFVSAAELDHRLRHALCLILPSRREGYGLAVLDAVSRGTPAVVVRDPDNAACDLIEPGVNGAIAASAGPDDLAAAILEIERGGAAIRQSTAAWWAANRDQLSIETGLGEVLAIYESLLFTPSPDYGWGRRGVPAAGNRPPAPSGPAQ
ncbi:MAG: glycosyltransferase [Chloroflexia bacterium]|nr:glycosyltransferase [Chloroflexia bacterium]